MQLVFRYIGSHLFAFLFPFSLVVEPKKLTGKDRISRKPPPLPAIVMELNDHLSVYNSYIHVPERTKRQTGKRERHHPAHHWMQALQSLLVIMLLPVLPKSWLLLSFSTGRKTACASKPPWILLDWPTLLWAQEANPGKTKILHCMHTSEHKCLTVLEMKVLGRLTEL